MDKPGYTPGPWKATRSNPAEGYDCWWITANHRNNFEKDLATVAGGASTSEANARLIAAAPEMFEALCDLSIFYGDDTEAREVLRSDFTGPEPLLMDDDALRESVWNNARAALSKALGEGQEDNG